MLDAPMYAPFLGPIVSVDAGSVYLTCKFPFALLMPAAGPYQGTLGGLGKTEISTLILLFV